MIKVTFKEPQPLVDYETISNYVSLFWLGFKAQGVVGNKLILFSRCDKYVQSVKFENIQSIEHVKPTDL